jgi:Xaa-Pro aminopeptidase
MEKVDTSARLAGLRKLMAENEVDVYSKMVTVQFPRPFRAEFADLCGQVVPSEDSHSSEYTAPCDDRREFISGFNGSAGCAVITQDKAALATDGRYFNQAAKQLDDNWLLLKQGIQDVPTWQEWAAEQAADGKVVAVDPALLISSTAEKLSDKVKKAGGKDLVAIPVNLVDQVWGKEKPSQPAEPVILLDEKYAGRDVKTKLADLRKELEKKESLGFVISMLDEIAWIFNLRGSDIPYNPVFFSYAIITADEATLYVESSKLDDKCQKYLSDNDVTIKPYHVIFDDLSALGLAAKDNKASTADEDKKFLTSTKASWAVKHALGGKDMVEEIRSPVGDAKAVKNDVELEGMRACHIRDGASLIEYFAWLEDQLITQKATLDEVEAADKLESIRKQKEHFVGLSFDTISSTGAK